MVLLLCSGWMQVCCVFRDIAVHLLKCSGVNCIIVYNRFCGSHGLE